jgi:hypothetical protein
MQNQRRRHGGAPDIVEAGQKVTFIILVGRNKDRGFNREYGEKYRERNAPAEPAAAQQFKGPDQSF